LKAKPRLSTSTKTPAAGRLIAIALVVAMVAPIWLMLTGLKVVHVSHDVNIVVGIITLMTPILMLLSQTRHRDINVQLEQAGRDLTNRAMRDTLTHLFNRAAFHSELDAIGDEDCKSLVLLFFDLDRFKDVNDSLGHDAGDVLLIEVARRVEKLLDNARIFARLGGDEFAAILPATTCPDVAALGNAIVEAVGQPFIIGGKLVEVGASVGIAVGDIELISGGELLRRADIAMYEAKAAGSGRCRIFDDVLHVEQTMKSSIRLESTQAIARDEYSLVYQPLVDARTGDLSSVEALLRWKSGNLGDVTPSMLIPIAEESGQIFELTDWTLTAACDTIKRLKTVPVAVNVSPIYFKHPDFVQRIVDRIVAAQFDPRMLTIEITESVLIANLATARDAIARLRQLGTRVVLDDFGTGFSSLSYLQHFELDGLKLDKSFIRDLGNRKQASQIIRAVIDFGHSLDMSVTVEGVESDWQIRLLQLLGCDYLQGYEISVPLPLPELISWIAKRTENQQMLETVILPELRAAS
jgi:diguanylate cyclase (GGDEF)-like protein